VETRDGKHQFEVQVFLNGLDPRAVRVQLYADGAQDGVPARQEMKGVPQPSGVSEGVVYGATVPANRPSSDYTARVIPLFDGVSVPLEEGRILWQR
jgi:starch phosphorylase